MRDMKAFRMILATVAMVIFAACKTTPISQAETFEQKAFALYGTYVIFQGKAAELVVDPTVPEQVKTALRDADKVSYPVAEQLVDAATEIGDIRAILEQCSTAQEPDPSCVPTNEQRLENAVVNLSSIYFSAQPILLDLVAAVKGAK